MPPDTVSTSEIERRDGEFIALLGKHELQLSACVHALVPAWQDAEDIIQDTRLRLWREFEKFRPGSDFPAWACTVARYMVLAHFKKNQRKPLLLSSELADRVTAEILAAAEPDQRRLAALAECVKQLGGDASHLLRRCYVEGAKIKDVAAELGRSLAGTYQAMSRIRRGLFDCVEQRLYGEEGP